MTIQTFAYAGWVPTITGHLSFSLIGLGSGVTANAVCAESAASGVPCRHIAVAKQRVTADLPYNGWPVGLLMPSTKAEYILLGRTDVATRPVLGEDQVDTAEDEIGVLSGEILVVPHHETGMARKRANSLVKEIRNTINAFGELNPRGGVGNISELPTSCEEKIEDAQRSGVRVLRGRFALFRTGEFRLTVDSEERDIADPLAKQMYYFAKDIAHRHYHHRPSTDNLLPLTPSDDDDTAWRRETLWALVRAVLEARRRDRLQSYKSAVGILAYAEAFQLVLAKVRRLPPGGDRIFDSWRDATVYDFSHTRASLEAMINEREFKATSRDAFKSVMIATGLGAIAVWVGLVQIAPMVCGMASGKLLCPPSPAISAVIRQAILHPSLVLLAVMFVGADWYGRRFFTLSLTAPLSETLDAWAFALGATLSRRVRRRYFGLSDMIGALGSAFIVATLGVAALTILAKVFRFY